MIDFRTFLLGLLVASTLTSLATEAVKKVLNERNIKYHANTLAGIVAIVLSLGIGIGYVLFNNMPFSAQNIIFIVVMIVFSWLCAMIGYDKVIQAIGQFKGKDE